MDKRIKSEIDKIFDEKIKKEQEIIKKAKAQGKWVPGLDSNKELFDEIEEEAKEKLQRLAEWEDNTK